MGEVAFAKQFLSTLDSRPSKLPSDYVADPRQLPGQPAYILPRIPKPYPSRSERQQQHQQQQQQQPSSTVSSTSAQDTRVTLSPLRPITSVPGPVTIPIPRSQLGKTSIYDVKVRLGEKTGYEVGKLKVLCEKRPVVDSKTLSELGGGAGGEVGLQVMYMGSPSSAPKNKGAKEGGKEEDRNGRDGSRMDVDETPVERGRRGEDVLKSKDFWSDLSSFVLQRVGDEQVAQRAVEVWSKAWNAQS